MTLETLTKKVEIMLDGEKKRRDVALKFVRKLSETLEDVAGDIWGHGPDGLYAVSVWKVRDNKPIPTSVYYRYRQWRVEGGIEEPGFYWDEEYLVWGKPIEDLRGKEFWYAIQVLIEWVPIVAKVIDKKSESREKLLSLICVE